MDKGDRDMPPTPKDFMAISHGNEWVSFYESFDKLVQDNLSRSSELLRRAMSLPEIADREVAQIRGEAEERIAAERSKHRDMLTALQGDLTGSHRQVSTLARTVGSVIADLERLAARVDEAISGIDVDAAPAANGHVAAAADAPPAEEPLVAAMDDDSIADEVVPVELVAEAEAALEAMPELDVPAMDELPSADFDLSVIQAAVEEQQAMLDAAEQHLDDLETSIDLNALAEAEVAAEITEPVAEPVVAAADAPAAEQRPRPHWLSVTRVGARQ